MVLARVGGAPRLLQRDDLGLQKPYQLAQLVFIQATYVAAQEVLCILVIALLVDLLLVLLVLLLVLLVLVVIAVMLLPPPLRLPTQSLTRAR